MENFKIFHKGQRVYYYIGNKGTVKTYSLKRKTFKILSPGISKTCKSDKQGYLQIGINIDGKNKSFRVHRIVIKYFGFRKNSEKNEVNHIDGNKHNNRIENLEWVTSSQNNYKAYELGLISIPDRNGKNNPNWGKKGKDAYLYNRFRHPIEKVKESVILLNSGLSIKKTGEKTGVPWPTIARWRRRKTELSELLKC